MAGHELIQKKGGEDGNAGTSYDERDYYERFLRCYDIVIIML